MRRLVVIAVVLLALVAVACRPYDFDGDGKADFVAIDADGRWFRSGNPAPIFEPPPGIHAHHLVPGDYDGNRVPEPAYVTVDGEWHTRGGRGTFSFPPPLGEELYAVPADYDGDGTTEAAWFRGDDATWFVEGEAPQVFGRGLDTAPSEWLNEEGVRLHDAPVPADYDGDGADDLATYRVTDGTFHVAGLGEIADLPVGFPAPGDYDGDGLDEPVVYRDAWHASHVFPPDLDHPRGWYFADGTMVPLPDPDGVTTRQLFPASADYDGDGDDDLALWTYDDNAFVFADGRPPVRVDVEVPSDGTPPFWSAATVRPWFFEDVVRLTFLLDVAAGVLPYGFDDAGWADHVAVDEPAVYAFHEPVVLEQCASSPGDCA